MYLCVVRDRLNVLDVYLCVVTHHLNVLDVYLCVVLTAAGRMTLTAAEKPNTTTVHLDFGHYHFSFCHYDYDFTTP